MEVCGEMVNAPNKQVWYYIESFGSSPDCKERKLLWDFYAWLCREFPDIQQRMLGEIKLVQVKDEKIRQTLTALGVPLVGG